MDVNLLSNIIKELIIDRDRIPVPGLGCFIVESTDACLSEDGKSLCPPSRKISFRSDETVTEDLAGDYYAETYDVDRKVVRAEMEVFYKRLKSTLFSKRSIAFDGLGCLRSTLEGNVYFVSDGADTFFQDVFSFGPIPVKPLVQPVSESSGNGSVLPELPVQELSETEPSAVEEKRIAPEPLPGDMQLKENQPQQEMPEKKKRHALQTVLILLAVLLVLFVIFLVLMKAGMLDSLIYSEEELELIRKSALLK